MRLPVAILLQTDHVRRRPGWRPIVDYVNGTWKLQHGTGASIRATVIWVGTHHADTAADVYIREGDCCRMLRRGYIRGGRFQKPVVWTSLIKYSSQPRQGFQIMHLQNNNNKKNAHSNNFFIHLRQKRNHLLLRNKTNLLLAREAPSWNQVSRSQLKKKKMKKRWKWLPSRNSSVVSQEYIPADVKLWMLGPAQSNDCKGARWMNDATRNSPKINWSWAKHNVHTLLLYITQSTTFVIKHLYKHVFKILLLTVVIS